MKNLSNLVDGSEDSSGEPMKVIYSKNWLDQSVDQICSVYTTGLVFSTWYQFSVLLQNETTCLLTSLLSTFLVRLLVIVVMLRSVHSSTDQSIIQ